MLLLPCKSLLYAPAALQAVSQPPAARQAPMAAQPDSHREECWTSNLAHRQLSPNRSRGRQPCMLRWLCLAVGHQHRDGQQGCADGRRSPACHPSERALQKGVTLSCSSATNPRLSLARTIRNLTCPAQPVQASYVAALAISRGRALLDRYSFCPPHVTFSPQQQTVSMTEPAVFV